MGKGKWQMLNGKCGTEKGKWQLKNNDEGLENSMESFHRQYAIAHDGEISNYPCQPLVT